jgi:hypothetical protein
MTNVRKPSEAPYTAAARPAGPGADDRQVVAGGGRPRVQPERRGDLDQRRLLQHQAIVKDGRGQMLKVDRVLLRQATADVLLDRVKAEWDGVAGQRVAQLVAGA